MIQVIYWDSDAFLALINEDKTPEELQGCSDVWAACDKGVAHIVTTTLTIAEVIHRKGTPKLDPKHRPAINNFFRRGFISLKPVTREVAELARDVVWDSNIKPKDAIHVATCAYYQYRTLHTFDKNLLKKSKVTIGGIELEIIKPQFQAQSEILYEDNEEE